MTMTQIKRLMSNLNLTQQQLADRIGVHRVTVADWVRGANEPRGLYLKALQSLAEEARTQKKQKAVTKIVERRKEEDVARENLSLKEEVGRLKRENRRLIGESVQFAVYGPTDNANKIYRQLAKKYHPDHNPQNAEVMKDINALWQSVKAR